MSSDSLLGMHNTALDVAAAERLSRARIQAQRAKARWWHKLIPFTVSIKRREP